MKVVITGTSTGIGLATAKEFILKGFEVHGIDMSPIPEELVKAAQYNHYFHNVVYLEEHTVLPDIEDVSILINNAGRQTNETNTYIGNDMETNLISLIKCTEKYGLQPSIRSIVNLASVSAHNGAEFPEYVASKGGVLAYTVWTAKEVAKYGATCNSISFGGVETELNKPVLENEESLNTIMGMTPLKKWATPEEAADWIYFLSVINRSCTGQDIIVDNGELNNHKFVWR